MTRKTKILFQIPALCLSVASGLAQGEAPVEDFLDLSLSELLSVEITSASKKAQPVSQAAAAIFVISRDDIRRSGVTSIPEALRLAPGLDVARIDGNKWAISSRGFNGRFANKLLVLMDGRSVYTPTFAGVYWDVQDTMLEDIDRIEVIRGPGASLWGSNAVNGVINIITKSAADTQGGLVSAGAGNLERGFGAFRYGGEVGDLGHYRVYAKYFNRGDNDVSGSNTGANDQWDQVRSGFRTDLNPGNDDQLTVQGDYYSGRSGELVNLPQPAAPYMVTSRNDQTLMGLNLLTRWQHKVSDSDSLTLQTYYDHTERDWVFMNERRRTGDLDFQYRTQRFEGHDALLGLGYRFTEDFTVGSFAAQMNPANRGTQLFSAFLQDDIELLKNTLTLTIGSKLEHNDFTGFEGQPNVRLLWTPTKETTLWASVARAVRIPSRADHNATAINRYFSPDDPLNPLNRLPDPPFNTNLFTRVYGNPQFDSESVIAYEAGLKQKVAEGLSVDLALFYNQYTRLRSVSFGTPTCQPSGVSVADSPLCLAKAEYSYLPGLLGNQSEMDTYGAELATEWRPNEQWRIQGHYTFLEMRQGNLSALSRPDVDPGSNPVHQMSLRTSWTPRSDLDLDLWFRYVDQIGGNFGAVTASIPGYAQIDLRAAWRPLPKLELSVVGFNLLDDRQTEFRSELGDVPLIDLQRSFYGQVRWEF